ncbi:MAG: 4-(cytidine 5'-diphospho)-2-C-methyl-D-erythritol kinase [Bacteroidetes bacterium]|nr:4-(cytidine 5'-diphospho)-2-C-methyl-D-erythritol kinase [Bacteroidota bacterium]
MVYFPTCKINLGLRVLHKRDDGYHELETIFYPLKKPTDALEIIRNPDPNPDNDIIFTTSGLNIAGTLDQNLCIKAYRLLKKDFSELPSIKMHLHKVIPMGAGLGGGSSDGAYTLTLLNKKFNLGLSQNELLSYALQLGSDCPFFILNEPCHATGRGEKMEPIDMTLEEYKIVVIYPDIHVSTSAAFQKLNRTVDYRSSEEDLKTIVQSPVATWKDRLINDFQAPVIEAHPEIGSIIDNLYQQNALYASLTGSGSGVYGIFEKEVTLDVLVKGYMLWVEG